LTSPKKIQNDPEEQILLDIHGNTFKAIVKTAPLFIQGNKNLISFFRIVSEHDKVYNNVNLIGSKGFLIELLNHMIDIKHCFEYFPQIHKIESDIKKNMVKNWRFNIYEVIKPLINKLKTTQLTKEQVVYLDMIERMLVSGMANITFKHSLPPNFTQQEIQVASLVGVGKSTKEIADLLNISERTIVFHRSNIRKKLGLKERSTQLNKYLSL